MKDKLELWDLFEEAMVDLPDPMTRKVFAKHFNFSPGTVANWDSQGLGINGSFRLRNRTYYWKKEVIQFLVNRLEEKEEV